MDIINGISKRKVKPMIESSVAMPKPRTPRGHIVPGVRVADMKIGDSFLIGQKSFSEINVIRVKAYNQATAIGCSLTIRKTPEGYRCWRIA
jgi:hypothetical protein